MKILLSTILAFFYFVPTFSQTQSLKDVAKLILVEFDEQNYEEAALNALDYLIQRTKKDNTKEFNFYNEKGYINWTLHQYIPSKRHAFNRDIEIKAAQNDLEAVIFWCGAFSFFEIAKKQYNDIESSIIHFKTKTKYHRDDVRISNLYMAYIFADIYGHYTDHKAHLGELTGGNRQENISTLVYLTFTRRYLEIKSEIENVFYNSSTALPFAYYLYVFDVYEYPKSARSTNKYINDLEKRRIKFQKTHSLSDLNNNDMSLFYKNIFE